jgi:hypothetical protein
MTWRDSAREDLNTLLGRLTEIPCSLRTKDDFRDRIGAALRSILKNDTLSEIAGEVRQLTAEIDASERRRYSGRRFSLPQARTYRIRKPSFSPSRYAALAYPKIQCSIRKVGKARAGGGPYIALLEVRS